MLNMPPTAAFSCALLAAKIIESNTDTKVIIFLYLIFILAHFDFFYCFGLDFSKATSTLGGTKFEMRSGLK
jgi:hypothetical protein